MPLWKRWKGFLPFAVSAIIIGLALGLAVGMYALYLAGVSSNTLEVSKSLIDVNAALLGFLGLIVVFMLTAVGDAKRLAEERMYRVTSEYDREAKKNIPCPKDTLAMTYCRQLKSSTNLTRRELKN